jgi:glycerophosphoryl diester phosphodiesterase
MPPSVVAHRGASTDRAEHTLAAYALAIEQGADGLECDVRLTSDGHLVCVHDRRIDRTSDGRGTVSTSTMADLSTVDFASWHHDPTPELGPRTLDALLGLIADTAPTTTLFVETKHPVRYAGLVETTLIALLARHGLATPRHKPDSPVVVMSFSGTAVRRIHDSAPHLPTVLLLNRLRGTTRTGALPPWADLTGPGVHILRADPDYVERARAHGHDTYCWTVDEAPDVALCQKLDVRHLATNSPAVTRRLLAG